MFKLDLENAEEPETKLPTSIGGLVAKSSLTLVTPWTVACRAPLSMGFSRQEYWSGLLFPSPEDLPHPDIKPGFPTLQADSLHTELHLILAKRPRSDIHWIIKKNKRFPEKASTSASWTTLKALTEWIATNWKILQGMGIPDHITYLLRNLYAGQEATLRTGHGTTDWFQTKSRLYIVTLLI